MKVKATCTAINEQQIASTMHRFEVEATFEHPHGFALIDSMAKLVHYERPDFSVGDTVEVTVQKVEA